MSKTMKNNPITKSNTTTSKPIVNSNKRVTNIAQKSVRTTLSSTIATTKLTKQSSKDEKEKLPTKPSQTKLTTTSVTTKLKSTSKPLPSKSIPLRAKHTPNIVNNVRNVKTTLKPNPVTTTYHNVTVQSPPPRRPNVPKPASNIKEAIERAGTDFVEEKQQPRRNTRTLEPEEIMIFKNDTIGPQSIDSYLNRDVQKTRNPVRIKESVSFDIDFSEPKESKTKPLMKNPESAFGGKVEDEDDGNPNYDDDEFESYESDFETDESSEHIEIVTDHSSSNSSKDNDDSDDDTQPPVTVIRRDDVINSAEKKLDSGNYDLNLRIQQQQQQQPDSLDTSQNTANSEQLDSGLGYLNVGTVVQQPSKITQRFQQQKTKWSRRGTELMNKIQLDTITFKLFELPPIAYEYFMKIYGNLNSAQTGTQTKDNYLNSETQTDNFMENMKSIWTQHPPQYNLKFFQNNHNFTNISVKNSCGEMERNSIEDDNDDNSEIHPLQLSIKLLNRFHYENKVNLRLNEKRHQIDLEHLNEFLNKSSLTIASIVNNANANDKHKILKVSLDVAFSNGYTSLNSNFLDALRVVKIFSNSKFNMILTVHESIDTDIYRNDFLHLISVWNLNEPKTPIRLLSSWSFISRADICTESSDIIVCGLKDGSVSMWDLRETHSYCSKLDGSLTHFVATHSIAPNFFADHEIKFTDLGSVVDIRSFKSEARAYNLKAYKQIQFVSLNDTGILTIWTLIETGKIDMKSLTTSVAFNNGNKMEYSSPWARVKLMQSAICDLRDFLELKTLKIPSKFDKTRLYFENDIFSDETLRELDETSQKNPKLGLQGLRFISLDASSNLIFIATNRNFILSCSKTLKSERFRKIFIDESKFLFPTAVRLHPAGEFLFVGLSNGSVIALNCNQNRPKDNEDDNTNRYNYAEDDEIELIAGKSCTIQNIIRSERKSTTDRRNHDFQSDTNFYDLRPRTAIREFHDESQSNSNNYDILSRLFDQQVILNGSVLRKNLVETIEISGDGRKIFALSDGDIRVYDLQRQMEINGAKNLQIKGICLVRENSTTQHSLVLMNRDAVQVHSIKP